RSTGAIPVQPTSRGPAVGLRRLHRQKVRTSSRRAARRSSLKPVLLSRRSQCSIAALQAGGRRFGARRCRTTFSGAATLLPPDGACIHPDHLSLLGQLPPARLTGLLAARPVFASAALYEPFGLSVLEAAQAGCALVLSDIATHRELWGDAALYVPARDAGGFA